MAITYDFFVLPVNRMPSLKSNIAISSPVVTAPKSKAQFLGNTNAAYLKNCYKEKKEYSSCGQLHLLGIQSERPRLSHIRTRTHLTPGMITLLITTIVGYFCGLQSPL